MRTCSFLPLFGAILLACQHVFSNESFRKVGTNRALRESFYDDGSLGAFWKSKHRRSVQILDSIKQLKKVDATSTRRTKPQFVCEEQGLKVILKLVDVARFKIHGPRGDRLRLDQLAAFCGVSMKSVYPDVHLLFSYDGCYVKRKANEHQISLNWFEADMVLSCPVSWTPSVTCKDDLMKLTVGEDAGDELSVAVNGELVPLFYVANQCWQQEHSNPGELAFSIPYSSCGITAKDGRAVLNLQLKEREMELFCPYRPTPHPQTPQVFQQKQPVKYQMVQAVPTRAASLFLKQEQRFVPRGTSWLPRFPPLPPGSFNLALNVPFSVPSSGRFAPYGGFFMKRPVLPPPPPPAATTVEPTSAPTEEPTTEPTTAPTTFISTTPFPTTAVPTTSIPEQDESTTPSDDLQTAPITENKLKGQAAFVESHQVLLPFQNPHQFQKPGLTSHPSKQFVFQEFGQTPGGALFEPLNPALNYNYPSPNLLQLNAYLSKLAEQLPPGYYICSNYQQPQMFQPPMPQFPAQYQPYVDQTGSSRQSLRPLLPTVNLQSQSGAFPTGFQALRPFQSSGFPGVSLQQFQQMRPLGQPSSQSPDFLQYQAGRQQYADSYRRSSAYGSNTGVLSQSDFQPRSRSLTLTSQLDPSPGRDSSDSTLTPKSAPESRFAPARGRAPHNQGPSVQYWPGPKGLVPNQ